VRKKRGSHFSLKLKRGPGKGSEGVKTEEGEKKAEDLRGWGR